MNAPVDTTKTIGTVKQRDRVKTTDDSNNKSVVVRGKFLLRAYFLFCANDKRNSDSLSKLETRGGHG